MIGLIEASRKRAKRAPHAPETVRRGCDRFAPVLISPVEIVTIPLGG